MVLKMFGAVDVWLYSQDMFWCQKSEKLEMCPMDTDTPAWKTLKQIANTGRGRGRTGVTLYALSTILLMARA